MKQFNLNLDKVAHELPLDLVGYMRTCTCSEEVQEVLETALNNEYVQALDWLYSVLSKGTIKEFKSAPVKSSSIQFVSELMRVDPDRVREYSFTDVLYEASELVDNVVFYDKDIMIRRKDQVYFFVYKGQVGSYYIKNIGE